MPVPDVFDSTRTHWLLGTAMRLSVDNESGFCGPLHVLLALVDEPGNAVDYLGDLTVLKETAIRKLHRRHQARPADWSSHEHSASPAYHLLQGRAEGIAWSQGRDDIDALDVAAAVCGNPMTRSVMVEAGVDIEAIETAARGRRPTGER